MNFTFSSLFARKSKPAQPEIACDSLSQPNTSTCDSLSQPGPATQPISAQLSPAQVISGENAISHLFLPTQTAWLNDPWPLRIWEKSRQVGATLTDALDSVFKASPAEAKYDVWVSSRDEFQSQLYLQDCKYWAKLFKIAAEDLGRIILDRKSNSSAYVLQFANGRRIYCLSSNPNAFAGKRGHVKIDEFALHADQRLLYKVAKPVTTWGGTLSIISTHRGPNTLFNQIIRGIRANPEKSPWHLYSYPLQKAIAEGLVHRINERSGAHETPEQFENRIHSECIDEDQWNQEYCCIPSDESTAFITHDMITACEDPNLKLMSLNELISFLSSSSSSSSSIPSSAIELYAGIDVGRKKDLFVLDVGQKVGDVMWDRLRTELDNQPFRAMRAAIYPLLALPQLKRCCIDATGNGQQLAEEAKLEFGYKIEPVHITAPVKEKLAFGLRNAFESAALRIPVDPKLRADIHAMKKLVTPCNNIRFDGYTDDSHCDRFMAKALRQQAAAPYEEEPWALLC